MRHRAPAADGHKFIEEIEAKQRNIVWPDSLRNSRVVDEFLWRGSPNAPLIQRIGAWLFGLTYFAGGAVLLGFARGEKSWLLAVFSFGWILVGVKIFLNGFRKRRPKIK